jgi:hypothetical protein
MSLANPYYESLRRAARVLRPAENGSPLDWLEQHVRIPHGMPRRFDRNSSPHLSPIIEAILDNKNKVVCCLGAVGTSKTTLLEVLLPYIVAEDPGPTMIVGQTDKEAEVWAETRGMPILRACEPIRALWPRDKNAARKMEVMFPHMPAIFTGPALSALQAKSIRWGFADEVWIWPDGRIGELMGRFHDRWNRRAVLLSQGGTEGTEWHDYWERTDKRVYGWDCDCGDWHEADWHLVKYDAEKAGPDGVDWGAVAATVRYEMPCGLTLPNNVQTRRKLALAGSYRATNPNPMPGYVGFQWPFLAAARIDPAEIIPQWIAASDAAKEGDPSKMIVFHQKRLARFAKRFDDDDETELTPGTYLMAEYQDGQLIDGEMHRFLTCDVGKNYLWALVRAWRADGSSRMLWCGVIQDFAALHELEKKYKIPRPSQVFVDGNYDPERVKASAASYGWTIFRGVRSKSFVRVVKGRKVQRLYSEPKQEQVGMTTVTSFHLAVDPIKDLVAMHLGGRAAAWEIPADVPDSWRNHMRAERKRDYQLPGTKQTERRWVKVNNANHQFDNETYQMAAALIVKLIRPPSEHEGG